MPRSGTIHGDFGVFDSTISGAAGIGLAFSLDGVDGQADEIASAGST
jgi:hypothetical protein